MAENLDNKPQSHNTDSLSKKLDNFVYGSVNKIVNGIRNSIKNIINKTSSLVGKILDQTESLAYGPGKQQPIEQKAEQETTKATQEKTEENTPKQQEEILQLTEDKDFNNQLLAFLKTTKKDIKKVVYLNAGTNDISKMLPQAELVYVDPDEKNIKAHQQNGHTAIKKDINNYRPTELLDLIILSDPNIQKKEADAIGEMLVNCGYFVTKGNPAVINYMKTHSPYLLKGVITSNKMETDNLDDYITPIASDEEFQILYPELYQKTRTIMKEAKKPDTMGAIEFISQIKTQDNNDLQIDIPFRKGGFESLFVFQNKSLQENIQTALPAKKSTAIQQPVSRMA
jgi:transposase